jgi:hypothetical protein
VHRIPWIGYIPTNKAIVAFSLGMIKILSKCTMQLVASDLLMCLHQRLGAEIPGYGDLNAPRLHLCPDTTRLLQSSSKRPCIPVRNAFCAISSFTHDARLTETLSYNKHIPFASLEQRPRNKITDIGAQITIRWDTMRFATLWSL